MLDFAQAASTLGLHISRFAEEITLYATAEFGFVELPEAFSTGSSAMPQKKNPDLTELARGKSARLLGAATALATLIKGLPLAYNKDLQEGQEQVFDAGHARRAAQCAAGLYARTQVPLRPMQRAAETGYLNAMAAATYLSNRGVPFRKAHEIVGNAVRLGLDKSGRTKSTLARRPPHALRPSSPKTSSTSSRCAPRSIAMTSSAARHPPRRRSARCGQAASRTETLA